MKKVFPLILIVGMGAMAFAVDGAPLLSDPDPAGPFLPARSATAEVKALARNPKSPNELLALKSNASSSQLYISANNGATWKLRADIPHYASDVAYDPQNQDTIYILTATFMIDRDFRGLLKSSDKGATFSEISFPLLYGTYEGRIAVHPTDFRIIFIALKYWPSGLPGGESRMAVLKTTDGGATWRAKKFGFLSLWGAEARDIVVSKENPNVIYMCGFMTDDSTLKGYSQVYISKNTGGTWKNITDLSIFGAKGANRLAVHPDDSNKAWVADDSGVARTANAGVNWTLQTSPSPGAFHASAIALDSLNAMALYAGWGRNCFKSTDGGLTWKAHSKNLKGKTCLGLLARGSRVHFVTEAGIFRSLDGGLTWTKTL
jgi:hypothetical protein